MSRRPPQSLRGVRGLIRTMEVLGGGSVGFWWGVKQGQLGSIGRLKDGEPPVEVGAADWAAVPGGCEFRSSSAARVRCSARRGSAIRRRPRGHEPRIASRHVQSAPRAQKSRTTPRPRRNVSWASCQSSCSNFFCIGASPGVEPSDQSHSSFERRKGPPDNEVSHQEVLRRVRGRCHQGRARSRIWLCGEDEDAGGGVIRPSKHPRHCRAGPTAPPHYGVARC